MWFIIMMYWVMHGVCWEPDDGSISFLLVDVLHNIFS